MQEAFRRIADTNNRIDLLLINTSALDSYPIEYANYTKHQAFIGASTFLDNYPVNRHNSELIQRLATTIRLPSFNGVFTKPIAFRSHVPLELYSKDLARVPYNKTHVKVQVANQ